MEDSKLCSKCKLEKSLSEFYKNKCIKSGYYPSCKSCKKIQQKELTQQYSILEVRETKDTKVCFRCKKEKNILEYETNRCRKDGRSNLCKECKYAYFKARKLYDPVFKQVTNMRSRLSESLRGKPLSQTTQRLIGIDFDIFTKWIEFQLEEGMTMENYGSGWHLDHVLPISSFNLLDEEELIKAMNWMNIRPLPPLKNAQKSNKIDRWLYVMQEVKAYYFIKHLYENNIK
jgi:hypothetical protein